MSLRWIDCPISSEGVRWVIAKKPAGIAFTVMDPEALTPSIDKAIDAISS